MLQAVQALTPAELAYVPATHWTHVEAAVVLAKVPPVQAMHGLGPAINSALPWP
jgi:hypothetical protein